MLKRLLKGEKGLKEANKKLKKLYVKTLTVKYHGQNCKYLTTLLFYYYYYIIIVGGTR
jgi:hypothetical protein